MNRPGLLLIILLALAVIGGRLLVGIHDRNTAPAAPSAPVAKASQASSDLPPPAVQNGNASALESALLNEAFQLSKARSLVYQDALEFQPTGAAGIQKAWQSTRNTQFPSDSLARLGLTLQLLGILPLDEDLTARYRLRASLSSEVFYDAQEGKLLHTEALDPTQPESKEWLSRHLIRMLLDQNFKWHEGLIPTEVNFDRHLAQDAFVSGDVTWQTLKHIATDVTATRAWTRTDSLTNNWPNPLRAIEFLGMREGVHFCQAVTAQNVVLDSVYQQLPTATSHILHPDRFLEIPRWEPQQVRWAQRDVMQSEPLWDNVIGELLIRAWLETATLPEDAGLIAARWEGDGVLLYQTETDAPQLLWKTLWQDVPAAERFFNLIRAQATKLFGVSIPTAQTPTSITYGDLLSLVIQRDANTVTVLRWTEDAWKAALMDLAQRSTFEKNNP